MSLPSALDRSMHTRDRWCNPVLVRYQYIMIIDTPHRLLMLCGAKSKTTNTKSKTTRRHYNLYSCGMYKFVCRMTASSSEFSAWSLRRLATASKPGPAQPTGKLPRRSGGAGGKKHVESKGLKASSHFTVSRFAKHTITTRVRFQRASQWVN